MRNSTSVSNELVHKLEYVLKYSFRSSDGHVLKYLLRNLTVKSKFGIFTEYILFHLWLKRNPVSILAVALFKEVNVGAVE